MSGPPPIETDFQPTWRRVRAITTIWGGFDMMTTKMAATDVSEQSVEFAIATVLNELDGIFSLKED